MAYWGAGCCHDHPLVADSVGCRNRKWPHIMPYWASSCNSRWLYASHGQITLKSVRENMITHAHNLSLEWLEYIIFNNTFWLKIVHTSSQPFHSRNFFTKSENNNINIKTDTTCRSIQEGTKGINSSCTQWHPFWGVCSWTAVLTSVWTWAGCCRAPWHVSHPCCSL